MSHASPRPAPPAPYEQVTGMCLGVVNARSNGVVASSFGRERPHLTQTLVNFAKRYVPGFKFSSIQVNQNRRSD
eukprot:COSAG01_NODE_8081_length_2929_cov_1.668198_3_plen_74_part_00